MFTHLFDRTDMDDDYDDPRDWDGNWCRHGQRYANCQACDDEVGDIDKCLNCGRYRSSESLDRFQVCKSGCRNPNEY